MKVSSVSPERWDTMTPHPLDWASLHLEAGNNLDAADSISTGAPGPDGTTHHPWQETREGSRPRSRRPGEMMTLALCPHATPDGPHQPSSHI